MATASRTVYAHITKNPAVCGGSACIDNTRIRVIDVVQAQSEGHPPEQIQGLFAAKLTLAQVYSALAYADENRHEIADEYEALRRATEDGMRAREQFSRGRSGT